MPFCHLSLIEIKPKNDNYLWKSDRYPAHPRHIGEQIRKRRFDLKMTTVKYRALPQKDTTKHQEPRPARARITLDISHYFEQIRAQCGRVPENEPFGEHGKTSNKIRMFMANEEEAKRKLIMLASR